MGIVHAASGAFVVSSNISLTLVQPLEHLVHSLRVALADVQLDLQARAGGTWGAAAAAERDPAAPPGGAPHCWTARGKWQKIEQAGGAPC